MLEKKFRLTFTEELLGTANADPEIHDHFIASKAPDAPSRAEEVAALGVDEVTERGKTVFPRTEAGEPFLWDYQIKGFFKDACYMLKKVKGTKSNGMRTYKKDIDGLIFVGPRRILLEMPEGTDLSRTDCQRPLRAQTPMGERVALAHSEVAPAGTQVEFTVTCLDDGHMASVMEWLEYGRMRGIGQWRNSGKGRFECEVVE